ncbi:hypothetical protein [Rhizobium leguminosarum]|uniref:Uncharacterized protein n=1 Tax=Rhizobium leguminosarum TaxID=384 RepID=A0A7M3DQG0_RHILE|nr:hypothetical protein [Rhizobium leguminosarum]TAY50921.1 hypothetical protein ELH90_03960 [Rhizobium leguminosarum]
MFRFLAAVVRAIIELALTSINAATAFLDWLLAKLTGGGGAAPADPVKNLEAALPDESRIDEARDLERGKAAVADHIRTMSPEMQVKLFACASEEDRLQADLSLLTPEQTTWLIDLSDDQLKYVGGTSDRRIAAALAGEHNAITAIRSVGQPEADDNAWLGHRIEAKRAVAKVTALSHNVGYAVH